MSDRVLISTHDLEQAGQLRSVFERDGFVVELVTPSEDIAHVEDAVLLVVTGWPDGGVPPLVSAARDRLGVPTLAALAQGTPHMRSAALAAGLEEAFLGPVEADEVHATGQRIVLRTRLQGSTGIVGETEAIRQALERVVQIAPVDSTVLVTGESGTGKELVARGIHSLSPRRHQRFIAVNVAALTETLLESELFGHEKGAFTGAIDSRRGFFELADKGTIFLDEIGEMPLATQSKLLRVLEHQEFARVGGEDPIRIDVRIVAATNRELRDLVQRGEFRRDLFYRLNVLHIELPPLRERSADVPLLVQAFIRELSERLDRPFKGISVEAMRILQAYSWPGNVRELQNLIESMVVLAPGREIRPEDIPDEVRFRTGESALLPTEAFPFPVAPQRGQAAPITGRPELEFVFRTLVDLRVDMDDLKREFEVYRRELPSGAPRRPEDAYVASPYEIAVDPTHPAREIVVGEAPKLPPADGGASVGDGPNGEGVVVFRPGMSMDDLERLAIEAALAHTKGNRRKAAEELGIGERTLYRKIQRYGLS